MYKLKNKEFLKIYNTICTQHDSLKVFSDFVKMCAISIYNSFAKNEMLENEYLQIINYYNKKEQELFIKMFWELIIMFEESNEIVDILGDFYMSIKPKNRNIGQVFTPAHISKFMAETTIGDEKTIRKEIKDKGFIFIMDPACGSGGLELYYAKALQKHNINYQKNLLADLTDISDVCVFMTYIQLSLYGIPAVVNCGNSLTQELRFKMETPLFFLQYYKFRKHYTQNKRGKSQEDIKKSIINQNLFREITIKGNSQISLW